MSGKVNELLQHLTDREDNAKSVRMVNAHRMTASDDRGEVYTPRAREILTAMRAMSPRTSASGTVRLRVRNSPRPRCRRTSLGTARARRRKR
jgi:hypothetical protein